MSGARGTKIRGMKSKEQDSEKSRKQQKSREKSHSVILSGKCRGEEKVSFV